MFEGKRIPIPRIAGNYVPIYQPKGAVYRGVKTAHFEPNQFYASWITNDFSVLYVPEEQTWHLVGITHPRPSDFTDDFTYVAESVHEAEYQLFHATAKGADFASVCRADAFADGEKLLYPAERTGESEPLWAPHLMRLDGQFAVVYSPKQMRLATTADWKHWTRRVLFECRSSVARDPYIYEEDGVYYLIYTAEQALWMRSSHDMQTWSADVLLQKCPFENCDCESPFLLRRDGLYYLFWSVCDGRNGCYDWRTMVYAADALDGFQTGAPLTMLNAHAPELVVSGDQTYLLSVFYPNNGVSAARLIWD